MSVSQLRRVAEAVADDWDSVQPTAAAHSSAQTFPSLHSNHALNSVWTDNRMALGSAYSGLTRASAGFRISEFR